MNIQFPFVFLFLIAIVVILVLSKNKKSLTYILQIQSEHLKDHFLHQVDLIK